MDTRTTCLVTGGAGFIGSHIAEKLLESNHKVRIFDNFSTGKALNIEHLKNKSEFIEGDIRNLDVIQSAMNGVDYVFHQAAIPSVPRSIIDPITTHEVNATGTLNVLIAARDSDVKRVVYASSSSVYGNSPVLPKTEDMPTNPLSPYAVSKLTGEQYCRSFYEVYGLETISLRYFNIFGPRQDPESPYAGVIPTFIHQMLNDNQPTIFGDGQQSRDFTFVSNAVQANLLACSSEEGIGEVFNVGCGTQYTLLDIIRQLNIMIGTDIYPNFNPPRQGDVRDSLADIQRISKLGYNVEIQLNQGLSELLSWIRNIRTSKVNRD